MLCHKCTNIHFKPIGDHPPAIRETLDVERWNRYWPEQDVPELLLYLHSPDIVDLLATAGQGCHFCITIQCRLDHDETRFYRVFPVSGEQIFLAIPSHGCKTDKELARSELSLHHLHGALRWDCRPQYSASVQSMLGALPVSALHTNQPPNITRRDCSGTTYPFLVDNSTLSEANMALASAWKNSCSSHHSSCTAATKDSMLPTRIINVQNLERPLPEDGGSRCDEYLTLSYKWGGTKRYLTSTDNVADHYEIIPKEELSKTFQDAIFVTHQLGFKYLWIDALCIIHDCQDDLQREISHMGDIYRGSSLTLFAEIGDSTATGLSVQRDPRTLKPCLLHLTATYQGHTTEAYTFAEYYPGYESEISPLYQRGWVLQEQVLSSRLLKFGHRQIQWECQDFSARESQPFAEDQPLGSLIGGWVDLKYIPELRLLLHEREARQTIGVSDRKVFECWYALVKDYSNRSLTYHSDNLLALAGIAKIIATKYGLSYINGIWEEDYCAGLLWIWIKKVQHAESLSATDSEPTSPSWTWLSQWGKPINFPNNTPGRAIHYMYTVSRLRHFGDDNTTMLESKYHPHNDTAFQHIIARSLTLHGYIIHGTVDHDRSLGPTESRHTTHDDWSPQDDLSWARVVTTVSTDEVIGLVHFDSNPNIDPIRQIVCCLSTIHTQRPLHHALPGVMYLAMIPTKQPGEYKRVGIVKWQFPAELNDIADPLELIEHLPSWCQTGPKQTITLV